MSDENLLSGKLARRSLPSLTPGAGLDMPTLKRLVLPQGELAQIHDSELGIHYMAMLELVPGAFRGNHYHHTKMEHLYLMRGEVELIAKEMDSDERAELMLQPGDLVIIQPGVAHAFRVVRAGVGVEFAPTRFDPSDIHPHQLT